MFYVPVLRERQPVILSVSVNHKSKSVNPWFEYQGCLNYLLLLDWLYQWCPPVSTANKKFALLCLHLAQPANEEFSVAIQCIQVFVSILPIYKVVYGFPSDLTCIWISYWVLQTGLTDLAVTRLFKSTEKHLHKLPRSTEAHTQNIARVKIQVYFQHTCLGSFRADSTFIELNSKQSNLRMAIEQEQRSI